MAAAARTAPLSRSIVGPLAARGGEVAGGAAAAACVAAGALALGASSPRMPGRLLPPPPPLSAMHAARETDLSIHLGGCMRATSCVHVDHDRVEWL